MSRERVGKLEALLARVQQRAAMPRPVPAAAAALEGAPVSATVPPTSDARAALAMESAARQPQPIEIDEVDVIPVSSQAEPAVPAAEAAAPRDEAAAEPVVEIEIGEPEEAPPPPSSKRPRPMEEIAAAQAEQPPLPPPPESGRMVAAVPAFDDDYTGVREASNMLPPLEPGAPPIEVAEVAPPRAPEPAHEMEAELSAPPPAASEARRISDVAPAPIAPPPAAAPPAAAPVMPVAVAASMPSGAEVVEVRGAARDFAPATFGELLDATLAL